MTTTNDNQPGLKELLIALLLAIVMIVIMFIIVPTRIIVLACFIVASLYAIHETLQKY